MTEEFFQGEVVDPDRNERIKAKELHLRGLFSDVFLNGRGPEVLDVLAEKLRAKDGMLEDPSEPHEAVRLLTMRRVYWWIHGLAKRGERIERV